MATTAVVLIKLMDTINSEQNTLEGQYVVDALCTDWIARLNKCSDVYKDYCAPATGNYMSEMIDS